MRFPPRIYSCSDRSLPLSFCFHHLDFDRAAHQYRFSRVRLIMETIPPSKARRDDDTAVSTAHANRARLTHLSFPPGVQTPNHTAPLNKRNGRH